MRIQLAAALAATLATTSVFAADTSAPLAPGKPAGVQKAQDMADSTTWLLLAGVGIVGLVVLATSDGNVPSLSSNSTQ